jgi:L-ascorbate metabolism protein UlaG (beta-lactamase superfamily)
LSRKEKYGLITQMDIKYLGHASFRLRGKTTAVVTDPFDPKLVGYPFPKITSDIVTISHMHSDHNMSSLVKPRVEGKMPIVINGPGEYEINGVKIYGYQTFHDVHAGADRGKNTVYLITIDGVSILHCGDLGHSLSDELIEEIGEVHVLLIPTGGVYTINEKEALTIVRQVDPSIVIPMHYNEEGKGKTFSEMSGVDAFLKEIGKTVEKQPKLVVTRDKLPEELEVVVLSRI